MRSSPFPKEKMKHLKGIIVEIMPSVLKSKEEEKVHLGPRENDLNSVMKNKIIFSNLDLYCD